MNKKNIILMLADAVSGRELANAISRILCFDSDADDGGPGSGNFGHAGRKGKRGGSAKRGVGSANHSGSERTAAQEFASREDDRGQKKTQTKVSRTTRTQDYREKFNKAETRMKVARGICKASREILKHRDMTRFEDLAFINAKTGKFVINKDFDQEDTCVPNSTMLRKIEQWGKENTIVLHNHRAEISQALKI